MADGAPRIGDRLAWLELADVWLVDPVAGREGPGSLTVEDEVITSVEWAEAVATGGGDGPTLVVAPGFIDLRADPASGDGEAAAAAHGGFVAVGWVKAEATDTTPAEANDGVPATILGLRGTPAADEVEAVARAIDGSTRPMHIARVSVAAALEPIRAARAAGRQVSCDVTPHHLALHDGWLGGDRRFAWEAAHSPWIGGTSTAAPYDAALRVDPPLRSPADALALLAAVADGTVDAIATDHRVVGTVEKDVPFGEAMPGIAGEETALGLVIEAVSAGHLSLLRAIEALTIAPWRLCDPDSAVIPEPSLRAGAVANLVVFDRAERWQVTPAALLTQGDPSPLIGRSLPGRVLLTVADGTVAWIDPTPD